MHIMDVRAIISHSNTWAQRASPEEFGAILIPSDEDENSPPEQDVMILHSPTCDETRMAMHLGTIVRAFDWDHKLAGHLPIRVGHSHTLDLSVAAYLEASSLAMVQGVRSRANSIHLYLQAIDSVQAMIEAESFWVSEEAQLAIAVLSAYESTSGSSFQHM